MKLIKYGLVVAAVIFLGALFFYNTNDSSQTVGHHDGEPWSAAMLEGSADAPHKLIEYTDYFCQFCAKFHEQASSDEFVRKYLDTGKVSLESRINSVLAGPQSPNSKQGGEAAFCAADQGQFARYSDDIIPRIRQDFFDKGIGVKMFEGRVMSSPKAIKKQPLSYFTESAENIGLDVDRFDSCMTDHDFQDKVEDNTRRAIQVGVTGLPFIVIDDYTTSGFDGGWSSFELMLKAGGVDTE